MNSTHSSFAFEWESMNVRTRARVRHYQIVTFIVMSSLESYCVVFEVLTAAIKKSIIFWDIMPYSSLKVNRRFGGTTEICLPPGFMLISCSSYSSTMKMEVIYSTETSVNFQRTTRVISH
jgi:hypothetical protein